MTDEIKEVEEEVKEDNPEEDTLASSPEQSEGLGESGSEEVEEEVKEKMLTQSQVNELVGRARQEGRESAMRDLFGRYGVSGDEELNDIFGKGQAYESLNDYYTSKEGDYKNALAENALLKSKIDEGRWEDVKLILGGKSLDITPENIESMIATHPEWRSVQPQQMAQQPKMLSPEIAEEMEKQTAENEVKHVTGTLRKLGNEAAPQSEPRMSEEDIVRKLYGY